MFFGSFEIAVLQSSQCVWFSNNFAATYSNCQIAKTQTSEAQCFDFLSFSPSSQWLFFISFIHTRKFCFCYSFHWVAISIISFYYCRIFALPDKIPLLVLFFYIFFKLVLSLCFYILFQMFFNNLPCAKIRQYKIDLIRIRVWIEWCTRTAEC